MNEETAHSIKMLAEAAQSLAAGCQHLWAAGASGTKMAVEADALTAVIAELHNEPTPAVH